jgi:hypothetical protein
MEIPPYYLKRPAIDEGQGVISAFDDLFTGAILKAKGSLIDFALPAPKWQFLNYLCDTQDVVMHGSGLSTIEEFEPRKSNDAEEFGDHKAVYAASDGIWAMYFAIVDRDRYVRSLVNTCNRVPDINGNSETLYYFSINDDALPHNPWRDGTIYVLSKETFEQQQSSRPNTESTQWRSFVPVKPMAKIAVGPQDFPFLNQIRGHDTQEVMRRAEENPDGFPWLDD